MSIDYYLKCERCKHSTLAFTDFDRSPEFFDVMKFIIEHHDTCGGGSHCFTIIDENVRAENEIYTKLEFIPRTTFDRYEETHERCIVIEERMIDKRSKNET